MKYKNRKSLLILIVAMLFVAQITSFNTVGAQTTVTLSSSTQEVTLTDGQTLTGTGGTNTHVLIADGASVILSGVNVTGYNSAGITCLGNASIVLADGTTNTVKGYNSYPGITVAKNYSLTIKGSGKLDATGGYGAAGIGAGNGYYNKTSCGDIIISGGTINASGGTFGAGIGSGYDDSFCGNIRITGGTVTATGGDDGAGIGSGYGKNKNYRNSSCGDITITGGVISATMGKYAECSIGAGLYGTVGTISIAGSPDPVKTSPYNQSFEEKYTVKFDANGGTGTMKDQTFCVGVSAPLVQNSFSRSGYAFVGWSTSKTGQVEYTNRQYVEDLVAKDGVLKLYAKWISPNNLPTGFFIDEDIPSTQPGFYYVKMPEGDNKSTLTINDLKISEFKIYDHTNKNPKLTTGIGKLVITVPSGCTINLSGSVLADKGDYFTRFYIFDGNYEYDSPQPNYSDGDNHLGNYLAKNGNFYNINSKGNTITLFFNVDSRNIDKVTGLDITAKIYGTYNLSYKGLEGATLTKTNPSTYTNQTETFTLNNPTKSGYVFRGWSLSGVYEPNPSTSISKGSTGDREYTAMWAKSILNYCTFPTSIPDQNYSGNAITPNVTIKEGNSNLELDKDYRIEYSNNINAGTATAKIIGVVNYTGEKPMTFKINPRAITATGVSIATITDQVYSVSGNKPDLTITDGTTPLTLGKDYTVSYSNNTNVGTATVTIKGTGNYNGSTTKKFTIVSKSIAANGISITDIAEQTYTGSAFEPTVSIFDGTTKLKPSTDYTVIYSNNTNAGTATVKIEGKGNYKGSTTKTFTIVSKSIAANGISITDIAEQTYTGSAFEPTVSISDGTTPLTLGKDYTVSYSDNTNVGKATVKIDGINNYSGTTTVSFVIAQRNLSADGISIAEIENQNYSGKDIEPTITITDGTTPLKLGTDYTVTCTDNVIPGTATATITGKGNYIGTIEKTFTIVPAPVTVTAEDKTKAFGEADPIFTAKVEGLVNNESADLITYTLTRSAGENVGEYAITAKGDEKQGNYEVSFVNGKLTIKEKENPEQPENPENPENPDNPEQPENPENPGTPVSSVVDSPIVKVWSFDNIIYIESAPDTKYTIIDLNGRIIKSATTKSTKEEISTLKSGVYIIVIGNASYKVSLR